MSGGKPIRERPGVGPWFKRLDEWDGLLGYSIDRMFRNQYDFVTTWHDIFEPNGKKLIAVSEDDGYSASCSCSLIISIKCSGESALIVAIGAPFGIPVS